MTENKPSCAARTTHPGGTAGNAAAMLLRGYRRFRGGAFRRHLALFRFLARQGQSPKALVVSCIDSRVDPALVLGARPGDILVARCVANLVPPHGAAGAEALHAALEVAVDVLAVECVVVLGHSDCGGLRVFLENRATAGTDPSLAAIRTWMSSAEEAVGGAVPEPSSPLPPRHVDDAARALVRISLANLETYPCVGKALAEGRLALFGWYFDIESGRLSSLDAETGRFRDV